MSQIINLIPQEEKFEQERVRVIKLSTILSIVLLLIVCGIGGWYLYSISNIKTEIAAHESNINNSRKSILNLSEVEINARTLDLRFRSLKTLFSNRTHYSILLSELRSRIPSNVRVASFSINNDAKNISLTGSGDDYSAVAQFINTLNDTSFSSASQGKERLFTNVTLNSVNLENNTRRANFFIIVGYDNLLLTK